MSQYKVLNVGGNSKDIPLPDCYQGWEHHLLDIDASKKPDIVADARNLTVIEPNLYDAVYCSHNLEHYYEHDAVNVLKGFLHVLKSDGHAYIRVPDITQLMQTCIDKKLDIIDVLYQSPMGPIRVCDVLYGHQGKIEASGEEYFAHKFAYSQQSLGLLLESVGFATVALAKGPLEVSAIAFVSTPTEEQLEQFNISQRRACK